MNYSSFSSSVLESNLKGISLRLRYASSDLLREILELKIFVNSYIIEAQGSDDTSYFDGKISECLKRLRFLGCEEAINRFHEYKRWT